HLGDDFPAAIPGVGSVHHHGQRIDPVAVYQQVDTNHVGRTVLFELIVHRRVTPGNRFELIEEIQDDLGQRHFVHQVNLSPVVGHVQLHTTLDHAQRHDGSYVFLRHEQRHGDDGLTDFGDVAHFGHARGTFDHQHRTVAGLDLVHHGGRRSDDVHVELAFEALLHDFHVQQSEEPATEAEAQRLRDFGLEHER